MLGRTSLALGATALIAACATTGSSYEMSEEVAAKLAEFEKTGEVDNCVPLRNMNINALDERNFLIRVGVNDYYLAELSSSCNGADRSFNRLQYETSLSQLCRGEIIRVIDNSSGFTVGSCGMSDVQKLRKIEEPAE